MTIKINLKEEVGRYFDDSSLSRSGHPKIVIIMGGVAVGKTTFRKNNFATGFVVVDAVEVFLSLCRGQYVDFPGRLEKPMETIGVLVAERAITEHRNIVTEMIGTEAEPMNELIEAMESAGYSVSIQGLQCGLDESIRRNENRGDDCVSAYYAEQYQLRWLIYAATSGSIAGVNT